MLATEKIEIKAKKAWKYKTLKEIGRIVSGGTPSTTNQSYFNGTIAWITPADLTGYNKKLISKGARNITKEGLENSSARLIPKGSVVFSSRAPIGYVAIAANELATNQGFKNVVPNPDVDSEYLYYYLKSAKQLVESFASGTTFKEISAKAFGEISIPLPPLEEQHRIVEKIEELFSELDDAVATLKATQQQLQTYRQSVLKHAFEGKFTGGMEGWDTKRVDEIAQVGTGATPLRSNKNFWENGDIPFVTSGALNDEYVKEALEYVTEEALNNTNIKLFPKHTLLVAMYGEGKTRGMCSELLIEASTNQAIAAIVIKREFEESRPYVKWFLLKNYNDLRRLSSGGVQPNLNLGLVKSIVLPFPSKRIQQEVISEIETRLSESDYLLQTINQQLTTAESLRQSILQRAFSGLL